MSAAIFGANLLEEIQAESLDKVSFEDYIASYSQFRSAGFSLAKFPSPNQEIPLVFTLLYDLRYAIDPRTGCCLEVLELDRLLDLFHHSHHAGRRSHLPSETVPSDVRYEHVSESLLESESVTSNVGKQRHDPILIELANAPSGIGSINLLYYITATSILPRRYKGKEAAVVWLDTKLSFTVTRLHNVCTTLLSSVDDTLPLSQRHSIVEDALKHVHLFSISSSKQLAAVLEDLQGYLLQTHQTETNRTKHYSMYRPLSLIILDSATAFHWSDRFDAEIARLEAIRAPVPHAEPQTQAQTQAQTQLAATATRLISKLKMIQTKFDNICIYTTTTTTQHKSQHHPRPRSSVTNPDHPPRPNESDQPAFSPWTYAATLSLNVTRIPVPQFASHMSLSDCLRDRAKRQEVVNLNRIRVSINEEWLSTVVRNKEARRAVARMDGRGGFVIRVNERGVEIER